MSADDAYALIARPIEPLLLAVHDHSYAILLLLLVTYPAIKLGRIFIRAIAPAILLLGLSGELRGVHPCEVQNPDLLTIFAGVKAPGTLTIEPIPSDRIHQSAFVVVSGAAAVTFC